jgi:N-dimethylarginine dimethylaminohydrolase
MHGRGTIKNNMKIQSKNEWDPLRTVVVGDATGARFPEHDAMFTYNKDITFWKETPHPFGTFPQHIIDEANEDLQVLADTLTKLGVTVLRPEPRDFSQQVSTIDWSTDGMYNYCPRDVLLVIDDMVIECPMSYRSRQDEAICYSGIRSQAIKAGARWISAPRPRLLEKDNYVNHDQLIMSKDEPIFDAANVLRLGNDILYLVSSSGNLLGAHWLQNVLGSKYRVRVLENVYSAAHIDSTITVLREGLVVLNGSRINPDNCPPIFKDWEKIYVNDVVPSGFYQYPYASKWIALNMFSVDPNTVICDSRQTDLIRTLESHQLTVIPLQLRHSRTLGGGFHCVTLDLHRE